MITISKLNSSIAFKSCNILELRADRMGAEGQGAEGQGSRIRAEGRRLGNTNTLPKLVSIEQFWSTFCTNKLLSEIWSQYKLWIFKILHIANIFFFVRNFYQENIVFLAFIKLFVVYRLIGLFLKMNNFDWFIWIKH